MRRHRILVLFAALGLTLAAACGGDDGEDIADVAEREADPGAEGDAGDVAAEGDGGAGDGVDEDAIAALTNEDCAALYEGIASAASAFGGTEGRDLTEVADYFDEIAGEVPDEIQGDFEVFAGAYREFAEAAADAGVDFSDPSTMTPEALEEMGAAAEAFNEPEVQEASENISTFAEDVCGTAAGG